MHYIALHAVKTEVTFCIGVNVYTGIFTVYVSVFYSILIFLQYVGLPV